MRDAYLLEALRTPRGKARPGGGLADVPPLRLLETLLHELTERTGLDPARVDDLVVGCATQAGEQGGNLARTAVLTAGWPNTVPGFTINRYCTSGIDAVAVAAALVRSGQADLIVAAGVESVSRAPMFSDGGPLWTDPGVIELAGSVHMGVAADVVATEEGFTREDLDAYGLRTHQRAAAAWKDGRFDRSLVVVEPPGGGAVLDRDEHVRPDTSIAALAAMEPAFAELGRSGQDALVQRHLPHLTQVRHLHTRGTSPALADGAGVVLVASAAAVEALGSTPRARLVHTATAGSDPVRMLVAGQHAVESVLARADLTPEAIDVIEYAEPFAALCLKIQRDLGFADDQFNVNGGTIAMGHAFGATGVILTATCLDELERRQGRFGLVGVAGAAGSGAAFIVERCP